MGQCLSSDAGNHVQIHLDRQYYSPGDTISGQVLLNCIQPFNSTALALKVEGYEYAYWTQYAGTTSYGDMSTVGVVRRNIFQANVPLLPNACHVPAGCYQFPFQCVLPMGIPGSLVYNKSGFDRVDHGAHARNNIQTKVLYKMKVNGEVQGMLSSNMNAKVHFAVHEPMKSMPQPATVNEVQTVKAGGFYDQGTVQITATLERDSYLPGETVNVYLQVQNASGASFWYVAVSLHRWVTIQYQNDVRLRLRDKVATARFPGVQSGEVVTSPGRLLPLQLPQDLQQSVSGMAVNYTYYIRVKLQGSVITCNPQVTLLFNLHQATAPDGGLSGPPYIPAGLSPQVAAPIAVQIPVLEDGWVRK